MAESIPLAVPVEAFRDLIRAVVREVLAETAAKSERAALTESEAAARLGLSPDTLRSERRLGRIDCCRLGRKVRFTEEQIAKYLARCRA